MGRFILKEPRVNAEEKVWAENYSEVRNLSESMVKYKGSAKVVAWILFFLFLVFAVASYMYLFNRKVIDNYDYICTSCRLVYIEEEGYPFAGVPAGTKFDDLPDSFHCPNCGADKSAFSDGFELFLAIIFLVGTFSMLFGSMFLFISSKKGASGLKTCKNIYIEALVTDRNEEIKVNPEHEDEVKAKFAAQILAEKKLRLEKEQTSDTAKYAEKEEKIKKMSAVLKKNVMMNILPCVLAMAGVLLTFIPVFAKDFTGKSVSLWSFIFDYGISTESKLKGAYSDLKLSFQSIAMNAFMFDSGDKINKLKVIEEVLFIACAVCIVLRGLRTIIKSLSYNRDIYSRIRENYNSSIRRYCANNLQDNIEWNIMSATGKIMPNGCDFSFIIFMILFCVFPISFGLFLNGWLNDYYLNSLINSGMESFFKVDFKFLILSGILFIMSITQIFTLYVFKRKNAKDLREALITYCAVF